MVRHWLARMAFSLLVSGAAIVGAAIFSGALASDDSELRSLLIIGVIAVLLGLAGLRLRSGGALF